MAALLPWPCVNLTLFHSVIAPNSKHSAQVRPTKRGKDNNGTLPDQFNFQTPVERQGFLTWAQSLKRVYNIEIET